jgi:hypothetical protein
MLVSIDMESAVPSSALVTAAAVRVASVARAGACLDGRSIAPHD